RPLERHYGWSDVRLSVPADHHPAKRCPRAEFARTFGWYVRCLVQRAAEMKRALSAIAGVGILALIVGMGTANAQSYRRYGPARAYTPQGYTPQSRGPVRREGGLRTAPFSDPNSPEATGGGSLGYNRTVPHW